MLTTISVLVGFIAFHRPIAFPHRLKPKSSSRCVLSTDVIPRRTLRDALEQAHYPVVPARTRGLPPETAALADPEELATGYFSDAISALSQLCMIWDSLSAAMGFRAEEGLFVPGAAGTVRKWVSWYRDHFTISTHCFFLVILSLCTLEIQLPRAANFQRRRCICVNDTGIKIQWLDSRKMHMIRREPGTSKPFARIFSWKSSKCTHT